MTPTEVKQQIGAAHQRHAARLLDMRMGRQYGRQAAEASQRLLGREIAAIRQRVANDNENKLARCAGTVIDFNPLTGMKEKTNVR